MNDTLKVTRTNEKRETLGAWWGVNVKVNYYWDNHGKLIDWNEHVEAPTSWTDAMATIEVYSFTECLINNTHDFRVVRLHVDNKLVPGELVNCIAKVDGNGKVTLHCKVVAGWG